MAKDTIIKSLKNLVVLTFNYNISTHTEIKLSLSETALTEEYSTVTNPTLLYVDDTDFATLGTSDLVLNIGEVTALSDGNYYPEIIADDVLLSGACKRILGKNTLTGKEIIIC